MAITKEKKEELVQQYGEWLGKSRAVILTEYKGLSVKDFDELRSQIREVDGEFHVVKNTLGKIAFREQGLDLPEGFFEQTTAVGFAFEDAPGLAKALTEFAKEREVLQIKGGYLGEELIDSERVIALAELPPLPEMRARLLGTIMAPASQLARILGEPGRQLAQVIRTYADRAEAPDAA